MKTVQIGYISNTGGQCYIDGKIVDLPIRPKGNFLSTFRITQVNGKVFCNTYEYKKGKWKHTLRAYWHYIFG